MKNNVIQFPSDDNGPRDLASIIEQRRSAMNVKELASLLGVSEKQIYALRDKGAIPSFRVGAAIRFDPFAIAQWLRSKSKAA